ncbi:unnamed protein product [Moneuplotes crassus]|uniref:Uncharacterized protein n=1 Tax=Euplotes crassus TaxID=5936 RepID=A0AAD2D2T9_EUPCR|nr:unnamed protein product [Moneuplotes crassus]
MIPSVQSPNPAHSECTLCHCDSRPVAADRGVRYSMDQKEWELLCTRLWIEACRTFHNYKARWLKEDKTLDLHFGDESKVDILKKMKKVDLPELKFSLVLLSMRRERIVKSYLRDLFPSRICHVNFWSLELISINHYLIEIIKTCDRVTKKVTFDNFSIKESKMRRILASCKHKKILHFNQCSLMLRFSPDIINCSSGATLEELKFHKCFIEPQIVTDPSWKLKSVGLAIWNSDLRKSLKEATFYSSKSGNLYEINLSPSKPPVNISLCAT